jgi:S-adenosylmethionine hydrolase
MAIQNEKVRFARVFGEAARGMPFRYENANGLVEIAVREGNAAERLGLWLGDPVVVIDNADAQ